MRSRINEKHNTMASYARWSARARFTTFHTDPATYVIAEYIRIRTNGISPIQIGLVII